MTPELSLIHISVTWFPLPRSLRPAATAGWWWIRLWSVSYTHLDVYKRQEYAFPFTDWGELWGIADRTNYDLTRHQEASGKSLEYFDSETNEHYIPYVIEPSLGCDRVALAFLCEAYDAEHLTDSKGKEDVRTCLLYTSRCV